MWIEWEGEWYFATIRFFDSEPCLVTPRITCDFQMVGSDLLAPAIHSAVPSASVPRLQVADHEAVGRCVQAYPGGMDERGGPQLWGEHRHPGVLDGGQGGAGATEPLNWADWLVLGFITLQDGIVSNTNKHLISNWNKEQVSKARLSRKGVKYLLVWDLF